MTERRPGGADARRWGFGAEWVEVDGERVLRLRGRLGYAVADELESVLAEAGRARAAEAVVDLGGVDYLSGGAAGRLAACADGLVAAGGRLRLRGLQQPVRQVLEYAGVLAHPAVVDDDSSAGPPAPP